MYRTEVQRRMFFEKRQRQPPAHVFGEQKVLNEPQRSFEVGDLVMRHIHSRARNKSDPVMSGPLIVVDKIGALTYLVSKDGVRTSKVHCDQLRKYTMPVSRGWSVAEEKFTEILQGWQVDTPDITGSVSDVLEKECKWSQQVVYSGVVLDEKDLDMLLNKFDEEKNVKTLIMVVAELPFSEIYKRVVKLHAWWDPLEPCDLCDANSQPVGTFPFNVWIVAASHE